MSRARGPLGLLAALATLLLVLVPTTLPARAATGDAIDSYTFDYVVNTDGTVDVTERLVYRFGPMSGRHGIERYLLTREPEADDPSTDVAYEYSSIRVSSPDAPDQFTTGTIPGSAARTEYLRIRVGDPDVTISAPTATYVLTYTVRGALRSQDGYDEFYWDATGFDWNATLSNVAVSVTVPEGATAAACYVGRPESTTPCATSSVEGGVVRAGHDSLAVGEGLTVAAQIRPGLIADNTPLLVPSQQVEQQRRFAIVGGLTGAVAAVSAALGALLVRSRRDRRYLDLPPGVVPPRGQEGRVGASPSGIQVPVAFSPPPISVAEAGLLVDGRLEPRETAATLVDLAVHGVLKMSGDRSAGYSITLVDPYAVRAPHEAALVQSVFPGLRPGTTVRLGNAGRMTAAHDTMVAAVRRQVAAQAWFTHVPGGSAGLHVRGFSRSGLGFFFAIAIFAGSGLLANLWLLLPVLPIVIVAMVVRSRLKRGQRTALGRALTDQAEGFREYLATAEADQIRFEEGEDIFSKYLPWAISFDLADRWAQLCQQLVDAGRIPDVQPDWFYGPFYLNTFSWMAFTDAVGTTVGPPPMEMSGGGTGFGSGGSAFGGGGGFSGGGGGGGGGGSW